MTTSARAATPRRGPKASAGRQADPRADRIWWLVVVAALFTGAQLAFVVPRLALSWDEVVYISQFSIHAPAAYFDPARARGVPLLAAPVTMLTSSVLALRVYLALASGLGLFLALLAWRGLRPAWQLALAGVVYGGLWVALYYGPQAMPDEWVAFSGLAAVGLFLRAASRPTAITTTRPRRAALCGLAGCLAIAALVRPGDAVFLAGALVLAVLAVPAWRQWQPFAAVVVGLVAGGAEWVVEAYLRFGGPLARLHAAGAEQGGFGLHFALWAEFRALNGPTLCRPCTVGVRYPEVSLWWLALPVLVTLGVLAARRADRLGSSLLAAWCGLAVAFQYLFLIDYAAPRFLLPAYALLAIPVADALGWLVTGVSKDLRPGMITLLGVGLALQLSVQNAVLNHQVAEKVTFFGDYARIAADLHHLGVRGPCLIKGEQDIPIAYYAGCASAPSVSSVRSGTAIAVLEYPGATPPGYARHWRLHHLPGVRSKLLRFVAYVAPH